MADSQSNAPLRADAGAPTSGVIHVRTRLTADFTVLSNALAQRRGSAVTVGVAAYISSLPDGTCVSIAALCAHFDEGEILVSRALRELEAAGYLERRRERTPTGQVRTRTYFYDVPGGEPGPDPGGSPRPPQPRRPRQQTTAATPAPASGAVRDAVETPVQTPVQTEVKTEEAPAALTAADPRAIGLLAGLRRVDPRLVLSEREAARLAPAVTRWLGAGLLPTQITDHLTARLPADLLVRPVGILAYRLKETPLTAPDTSSPETPERPAVLRMRNCDGCDRGFRSAGHSHCRDCRTRNQLPATG
ncbi:hypothetical protein [Streptomyces caniscabiei]|uniref:DNA-binding protein n=1 Tax=Streptomyces caniscabiei TaxID=2746961 RepID=A0ABU4N252_9ACTN|nr:hypothetical protein [Streptomyces caniscabiei]MBE4735055.1 hypothetical protein [Streptomyces caniscabiei]MBE4754189.1 hypothetical protein [Streptomyces caniscabiei]MBE4767781.1 hypothetical protein [Streptomyces caniscabiei]MBE4784240.1 hypothetical protein [Streptomyces caniscabiei]MBE4791261.1 hypothetical protein [Streptomyces caniscabiei]